jgi:flagellar biosynthesis chaperone FliJ
MSVEFSNAYQEILLDNFNSVIKQNMMFQTQLRIAEESQKNNNTEGKINELSLRYDEKINLLNGEYNLLKSQHDEALKKIAELEPRVNISQSLHDEKTRIQSALNEEMRKNTVHREEIQQRNVTIEELNKKITEQSATIETQSKKIADCENELVTKNKEIEDLNSILEKKEPTMPKVKKTNSKNDMTSIVADGGSF